MTYKLTLTALALSLGMLSSGAALALPSLPSAAVVTAKDAATPLLETVRYRGGYYGRGHYGRGFYRGNRGAAIGLGIAGAIVGSAIIANEGYRYRRYDGVSGAQRCANTYRSYDWDSGTYMGYDGVRRTCPYL